MLFLLNLTKISIIANQFMKVLKIINYKVIGINQIQASIIALWGRHEDFRAAQKKARRRFIGPTENLRNMTPIQIEVL